MTGRDRLEIGTYGDLNTTRMPSGNSRAEVRYRDGDGAVRQVITTAATVREAKQNLRTKLQRGGWISFSRGRQDLLCACPAQSRGAQPHVQLCAETGRAAP